MGYSEAIEYTVTKEEARKEIRLHGLRFRDFTSDLGNKQNYSGSEVLNWLGY